MPAQPKPVYTIAPDARLGWTVRRDNAVVRSFADLRDAERWMETAMASLPDAPDYVANPYAAQEYNRPGGSVSIAEGAADAERLRRR